jgi:hypothetical protein
MDPELEYWLCYLRGIMINVGEHRLSLPFVMPIICATLAIGGALDLLIGQEVGSTTPTTILGAFIVVALGALSLIGWIVREQFKRQEAQDARMDAKGERLDKALALLQEAVTSNQKAVDSSQALAKSLHELVEKLPPSK